MLDNVIFVGPGSDPPEGAPGPGREVEALRAENSALKAASAVPAPRNAALAPPMPSLSRAREQVQHFRSWAFSAIRCIANRIAGQPIKAGRKDTRRSEPTIQAVNRHRVLDSLADPNPIHTPWSLKYLTVCSLELTGRCFWWLADGNRGQTEIWPLATSWVEPVHEPTPFASFKLRLPGWTEPIIIPGESMMHFSYPDPADPIYGALAPLQAVAHAVVTDEAIQSSQWLAFRKGINPSLVIIAGNHPDMAGVPSGRMYLTQAQRDQIRAAIYQHHRGFENWEEPLILDAWIQSVEKLSRSPQEMAFLDSSKLTQERVFLGFGVNPVVAGQLENANRASAIAADEHFVGSCCNPKISLLSECLTGWLAPRFNDPGLLLWLEPCRTHDPDAERLDWDQAVKARAVTINEVRARIGLAPIANGDELVQAPAPTPAKNKRILLNGRHN